MELVTSCQQLEKGDEEGDTKEEGNRKSRVKAFKLAISLKRKPPAQQAFHIPAL